jgi:uncharacterized membrane protein
MSVYKLLFNIIIIWFLYIISDALLSDQSSFKIILDLFFYLIGLVMILEYVVIIVLHILNDYHLTN